MNECNVRRIERFRLRLGDLAPIIQTMIASCENTRRRGFAMNAPDMLKRRQIAAGN
jgi:hypothetical protein